MRRTLIATTITAAAFVWASVVTTTQPSDTKAHVMVTPSAVTWGPGPASVPAGAQAAVLEGDPAKAGLFTLRLKMPDGYKIAPHYHPADEHVTVFQGTFVMGMGEKFDQSAGRELAVGSFASDAHWDSPLRVDQGRRTIVQLHGVRPWGLAPVQPGGRTRERSRASRVRRSADRRGAPFLGGLLRVTTRNRPPNALGSSRVISSAVRAHPAVRAGDSGRKRAV